MRSADESGEDERVFGWRRVECGGGAGQPPGRAARRQALCGLPMVAHIPVGAIVLHESCRPGLGRVEVRSL